MDSNFETLRFQIGTIEKFSDTNSKDTLIKTGRGKHSKYLPWAFTEEGVAMLSAVLHSEKAVEVSVKIIQAFVLMRKTISNFSMISDRITKSNGDLQTMTSNSKKSSMHLKPVLMRQNKASSSKGRFSMRGYLRQI